ncbi:MAG: FAD-binding protein [Treponema sp.]|nr:FAD-binding protein [Treponema sp.]
MKSIEQIAQFFNDSEYFTGNVKINENLAGHTTMHVGGSAKLFLEPENEESIVFAIKELKKLDADERGLTRIFILGGGSNVIISDDGLDAVISTRKMNKIKFLTEGSEYTESLIKREKLLNPEISLCSPKLCEEFKILCLESGVSWGNVISFCRKNNLGGFEAFTGLSGTVGGALFMNATCFGLSACDNLLSVRYFDLRDGKIHEYQKIDSDWGYKKSPFQSGIKEFDADEHRLTRMKNGDFKGQGPLGEGAGGNGEAIGAEGKTFPFSLPAAHCSLLISKIILSAKFSVKNGFDSEKSEKCISDRKEKGHFRAPSAGSAFKNDAAHGIIAGKVIDDCGLKGFSVGGAQIAPWHGNFIINPEQKACASDIKKLSDEVKKIVREKTGVELENEILFI